MKSAPTCLILSKQSLTPGESLAIPSGLYLLDIPGRVHAIRTPHRIWPHLSLPTGNPEHIGSKIYIYTGKSEVLNLELKNKEHFLPHLIVICLASKLCQSQTLQGWGDKRQIRIRHSRISFSLLTKLTPSCYWKFPLLTTISLSCYWKALMPREVKQLA